VPVKAAGNGSATGSPRYADLEPRSPWITQLEPDGPPRPLNADATADVVIVGAGIAGVATAYFVLRSTNLRVLLVERDRVARGATGRNAGQLTTYFERPLDSIAREFGPALAAAGQQAFDDGHELLDELVAETGSTVRVDRFVGHMGMYSRNHVVTHLRNNLVRRRGGLREETCLVSEDAEFLADLPPELADLYRVVPQAEVAALLETQDDRYRAVLSDRKGCANSGLLVQQVLAALERGYPDRLRYVDRSQVDRVVVGSDGARLHVNDRVVTGGHAVLCTNGFTRHTVEDAAGAPIELHPDQRVVGTIGFMAAFVEAEFRPPAAFSYIRNAEIGGDVPYVYVTRRTYDQPTGQVTLTCMGGPEWPYAGVWEPDLAFPGSLLATMDEVIRPFAQPARPPGQPYDFQWHGLMGYTPGMIRVVGSHPRHPALLYNLGCNGVGFLPSIAGGSRIGRLLAGESLGPSIFDPRD
jgi:glycine/D-amino acid oxidase-like deaminating enzyme